MTNELTNENVPFGKALDRIYGEDFFFGKEKIDRDKDKDVFYIKQPLLALIGSTDVDNNIVVLSKEKRKKEEKKNTVLVKCKTQHRCQMELNVSFFDRPA